MSETTHSVNNSNLNATYSNKFLLDHLKELTKKLGRTIGKHDIVKAGKVSYEIYHKRFGNLQMARKAAGLVKTRTKLKYSDGYLLSCLKQLNKRLGRRPKTGDIIGYKGVSVSMYVSRFGSFKKALEVAGFKPIYSKEFTRDELIAYLQKLNALEAAGFRTIYKKELARNELIAHNRKNHTDEELIAYLKELTKKLNRPPRARDINERGQVSYITYYKRFGSLKKALEAAELEPTNYRMKFTDEELVTHLQILAKKLDRLPNAKDINKAGKVTYHTYYMRFGSIAKARKAAGLKSSDYDQNNGNSRSIKKLEIPTKKTRLTKSIKQPANTDIRTPLPSFVPFKNTRGQKTRLKQKIISPEGWRLLEKDEIVSYKDMYAHLYKGTWMAVTKKDVGLKAGVAAEYIIRIQS